MFTGASSKCLRGKLTFLATISFILTFTVTLVVLAIDTNSGSFWMGNDKVLDYSIMANLEIARYDGSNEWYLESGHFVSTSSFDTSLTVYYGFGHGWYPTTGWEDSWSSCDEHDTGSYTLGENDYNSESEYGWAYDEYADVAQYRAIASTYVKATKGAWSSGYRYADDCQTVTR